MSTHTVPSAAHKAPKQALNGSPSCSPSGCASPSFLSLSPRAAPSFSQGLDASASDFELPGASGQAVGPGKVPVLAPVPEAPPEFSTSSLISGNAGIGIDESYSKDEQQLNEFLKLHPMLSSEATSSRTLQLVSTMFEKASVQLADLPVVGKSHDDCFLCPANEAIGERACVNGERCLANFVAKMRFGIETDMAFVCKEFLLPAQKQAFLEGRGLPARRGKCLMCTRYFQHYVYILARTDPSFVIGESPIGLQVFSNSVTEVPGAASACEEADEADLKEAAKTLPTHTSIVSATDGYRPEATLFVDEDWAALRAARESNLRNLLFRPVVRFSSKHYHYIRDDEGLRIVQLGIGADDDTNGLHFRRPAASTPAVPPAKPRV